MKGKPVTQLKLPFIQKQLGTNSNPAVNKSLKLEKINRQRNIAMVDINQLNKIEK